MAKRNRSTLKHFFKKGALPTADHFGDLVDSSLNMIDEGFDKSLEHGLEISSMGSHDRLISFFRNNDHRSPLWSISYDDDQENLLFYRPRENTSPLPIMSLDHAGKVGVNKKKPEWELDVAGVIRAQGRIGISGKTIAADGEWHSITEALSGCQAFEVMAGVGKKKTGKYALMHAYAFNTFNPRGALFNFLNLKKRIRCHQAYYLSILDKLKLRWSGDNQKYYLQIRSNSDYGEGIQIKVYLTKLWHDEDMSECWLPQNDEAKD
jgi:hypothetical protein